MNIENLMIIKAMRAPILLFFIAMPCFADDLVVDWSGKGVEGIQALNTDGVPVLISEGVMTLPFEPDRSWRPGEGLEQVGESTVDFSIGVSASVGGSPASPNILRIENIPSGGRIHILLEGSEAEKPEMRGILAFTKNHFINGGADESCRLTFDEQSVLTFSGILDGRAPESRWLVRDGNTWYVSEATLAKQREYQTPEQRDLSNPESIKWAEYYPNASPLEQAPQFYIERKFENITAVGLWFDSYGSESILGGTYFTRFAVDQFQAILHHE